VSTWDDTPESDKPLVIDLVPSEDDATRFVPAVAGARDGVAPEQAEQAPVRITPDGAVSTGDRRLSTVTNEAFGISEPSLQQIRDAWEKRSWGTNRGQTGLAVTPQGQMVLADPNKGDRTLSQLTSEVFAATAADAVGVLPPNATWMVAGGVGGWVYTFTDSHYGDPYTVFLYESPSTGRYHAKLIDPKPSELTHHHWYSDGRMCLSDNGGSCDSVEHAHARVVAWAKASSHWRRTGQFLFD